VTVISKMKRSEAGKKGSSTDKAGPSDDLRRVPTQERSRKRFDAILNAAAEAFASQGFDATKMESVASSAGTSIGSVYQFFANKRSLFRAVADRCLDRSRKVLTNLLVQDVSSRPWTELLDDTVDAFAKLHRVDPAFRALMTNLQLYSEFEAADRVLIEEFSKTASALFARWAPHMDERRRDIVASLVVNTIASMLVVGAREKRKTFDTMLEELKLMIRRYLEPELTTAPVR